MIIINLIHFFLLQEDTTKNFTKQKHSTSVVDNGTGWLKSFESKNERMCIF